MSSNNRIISSKEMARDIIKEAKKIGKEFGLSDKEIAKLSYVTAGAIAKKDMK